VTGISVDSAAVWANTAFGWLVRQFFEPDIRALALGAFGLLLIAVGVRRSLVRARRLHELEFGIEDLRAANHAVRAALDDTKRQVAEATLAIAKKSEAREKKITGELQIIEGLIRDFATNVAAKTKAQTAAGSRSAGGLAVASSESIMLDIIRRSLEENRVDLYLQPIVGLPQRKLRFYEALSRLRSDDGAIIMPEQYIKVAGPAGLMSVVDNLLLLRCVQIVRRLTQKQRELAVFCNISAPTLSDPEFFPQFLDFMHHHRDLSGHIIFEFTQDAVLAARATEEANLRYLANLGFRLSIDNVTKLDVDFAKLRRLGFQFFKLKADTLISGMKQANAAVAAEDFKDLLFRNGLNLIVERVEDEKTVVQLLEYNVDFGQGYLFGVPKPVREVSEMADARATPPSNVAVLPAASRRLAS
jgi:cyclic-di-GMP phosphodiesterase TipF (flagellum assembly factor)